MKFAKNIEKVLNGKDIELINTYKRGKALAALMKDNSNGYYIFQTSKNYICGKDLEGMLNKIAKYNWELV